jgi:uncharacterized protein YgbK (DUF1537 family)
MTAPLPDGLLLAYYGDDFTGSTDAMEAFTLAGVPTVLFLDIPTPAMLGRFPGVRCAGLAGSSRGRSPAWMRVELAAAFDGLAALGAPLLQYKICSTFDSSPEVGSIGCAIDLGVARMQGAYSPMIVGAPRLNRFQVFGNLFASVDGTGYRLDRHPTMSRHPVTPMGEADLRLHLGRQTARRIGLVDFVRAKQGASDDTLQREAGPDVPVVMLDVCDDETLCNAGRLVWEGRAHGPFTASSSGLQYALVAYWRAQNLLPSVSAPAAADPVSVIAAVSGSCSPVTARQIACAREEGFHVERLDVAAVLDPRTGEAEVARAVARAAAAIAAGTSAIVCSAEGPDDPAVLAFGRVAAGAGLERADAARRIGMALAEVMRRLLDETGVRRVVVAGGDSSGEVTSALGMTALTVDAPLAPGAPLCRAWSDDPARDGVQIVLKGGQMGGRGLFGDVRAGRPRGT